MLSTHKGFTLIEMLVALVIFSSLMSILLSGYMQGVSLWHRAEKKAAVWQVYQNRVSWMQRLTEQIVAADYRVGLNQYEYFFKGDMRGFETMTSAPILSPTGRPVHVEFRLQENANIGKVQLLYREGAKGDGPEEKEGLSQVAWVVLLDDIDNAFFRYYRLPSTVIAAGIVEGIVPPTGWLDSAVWMPGRIELNFDDANGVAHSWHFYCQVISNAVSLSSVFDES